MQTERSPRGFDLENKLVFIKKKKDCEGFRRETVVRPI